MRFVYFASRFNRHTVEDQEFTHAWTAVSKLPWLTALALWPKGDCWWGGGLFLDNHSLFLNHRPSEAVPHPQHKPAKLRVSPNPDARGEDDPLYSQRLDRDGWARVQEWVWKYEGSAGFRTDSPEIREKPHWGGTLRLAMERVLEGYSYRERYRLIAEGAPDPLPVSPVNAADWLPDGRLAMVGAGRIYVADVAGNGLDNVRCLIDLTGDQHEPRTPPSWATVW